MCLLDVRMQWSLRVYSFSTLVTTSQKLKIPCYCPSLLIIHLPCPLVTNPTMCTSSPGVHPQQVLEAKVFPQRLVHDLDRHCDECPALVTNLCLLTARSDVVVICHINIKDQLFCNRSECARLPERLAIAWVGGVDWSNLESDWCHLKALFLELVC